MAKSILDALQAPQLSQSKIAEALRSRSGKATQGRGPAASNIGERAVQAEGAAGMQQLAQQEQVQQAGQQQASQKIGEQARLESSQQQMQDRAMRLQQSLNIDSLLQSAQQAERELDTRKYASSVEQLGFAHALQDRDYVAKLQRQGALDRLGSAQNFDLALQKSIFADDEAFVRSGIDLQALLNADEREFNKALANLDIDFAIDIAKSKSSAEREAAKAGAVGSLIQGGAGIYGAKQSQDREAARDEREGLKY